MARPTRVLRGVLLWTAGTLGALSLLALVAGWIFSLTPLVFTSGSMSPAYDAGALGLAHRVPADSVAAGDVVSVVDDGGRRVTHRVVSSTPTADGRVALTLRGDANDVTDPQVYVVESADRVVGSVPWTGRAVGAVATPVGLVLLFGVVLAAVGVGFGADLRRSPRVRRAVGAGVVGTVAASVVLGATGNAGWAFTSAYWTDNASATTTATTPGQADTTKPVLSNPLPAADRVGGSWSDLDCADSGAALSQICVNATDEAGGSGLAANGVKVVLTRTLGSGTTECWNGLVFVAGSGCAAQTMASVSGSQFRTSGLTALVMTQAAYQAVFTATDVAGNTASLTVGFAVLATPTITGCSTTNGSKPFGLTWTFPTPNPSSFSVVYSVDAANRSSVFAGSARSGNTVPINGESGTFRIRATIGSYSTVSNSASYSGNGNKTCTVNPN